MKITVIFIILLCLIYFFYNINSEYFSNQAIKKHVIKKQAIKKQAIKKQAIPQFSNKFTLIFTKITGEYNILIDNDFWHYNRDVTYIGRFTYMINNLRFKKNINIITGCYNYNKNELILLNNTLNIFILNLTTFKISKPIFINNFINKLPNNIKIDSILYINDNLYIFSEKQLYIYCLKNEILIKKNIKEVFKNLDIYKINFYFLNYNHLEVNNPIPYIYINSSNKIYIYKYENKLLFTKIKTINNKINNYPINTEITQLNYNKQLINYIVDFNGNYRFICIGGGIQSGGYGGLLFNDYYLKKNDSFKIIVGGKGIRLPVKENLSKSIFNNKLEYNGSCSGAGASLIFKKNKVIMCAGGGGGWSSEIIISPYICNSLLFNLGLPNNKLIKHPNFYFPLSKIILETERTKSGSSYKLSITKFDIKIKNRQFIDIEITENPLFDKLELKNKKYIYETNYSKYGEKATIEIIFDSIITDYSINLDYIVESFPKKIEVNTNLLLFNEKGDSYIINNPKTNFTTTITSKNIINYLTKNSPPKIITPKKNIYITNGKNIKKFDDFNFEDLTMKNNIFFPGGIGGGGNSYTNRYNDDIMCGGGGGYFGGKSCILSNYNSKLVPTNYIAASGGASYIDNLNLKKKEVLKTSFINNYNDDDGKIIIVRIF